MGGKSLIFQVTYVYIPYHLPSFNLLDMFRNYPAQYKNKSCNYVHVQRENKLWTEELRRSEGTEERQSDKHSYGK